MLYTTSGVSQGEYSEPMESVSSDLGSSVWDCALLSSKTRHFGVSTQMLLWEMCEAGEQNNELYSLK